MDNLQNSAVVVSRILTHLIDIGLLETTLCCEDLNLEDDLKPFFPGSMKWLEAEGLIRFSNSYQTSEVDFDVINPVLTSKGFEKMGRAFDYDGKEMKMKEIALHISKGNTAASAVGEFLGSLSGSFYKSTMS